MQGPLTRKEHQLEVQEVVSEGGWRWDDISMVLPEDVVLGVQATLVAITARSKNKLAWAGAPNDFFSTHSAYALAVGLKSAPIFQGQWIWKTIILPKIQLFCGNAIIIVLELDPIYMLEGWAQTPIAHYASKLLKLSSMLSMTTQLLNQFGIN